MKVTKLMFIFATLALVVASAASSYTITLAVPTQVGDNQLKAGQYKLQVEGDKTVFIDGKKNRVEIPVTVEKNDKKYSDTTLDFTKSTLREIHLGGTNTKIIIKSSVQSAGGGN